MARESKEARRGTQPIKILVVDDEQDICDYMSLVLSQNGYQVNTLTNPLSVVDELKSNQYHIVILDLMMPKLSGI